MATHHSLANGTPAVDPEHDTKLEDMPSPILPSDAEVDSNEEHQPPTRSPTPTPPLGSAPRPPMPSTAPNDDSMHQFKHYNQHSHHQQQNPQSDRVLHVPAPLRRNTSNCTGFNEIPSLPAFLNNCNLSQYLQSFNEAGATDDSMQLIIDFDDDELKSVMEAIPMKPFHAVTFRKGIRDLRERSRMGSMHFDNPQSSFMQPEPHSMLHYSHSQFFQQTSQHSQPSFSQQSHPSQSSLSSSQPTRGYTYQQQQQQQQQGGPSQTPGLHRQSSSSRRPSSQPNSSSQPNAPTPSQVLSGGSIYQYVGPAPRPVVSNNYSPQPALLFSQEQPAVQRSSSKNDHRMSVKRRRSSSGTPTETALGGSSPVLPEPSSFNSNSSSCYSGTPNNSTTRSQTTRQDSIERDIIMQQALIYGKHSSRSLTKYEHAINCAAQSLALDDKSLLANKGLLWNKAKAKLLEEDYDYKRGKSRSKLPEASQQKKEPKSTAASKRERLMQKREVNASNAATMRLKRIASLGEILHRKTADREALLAHLLRLESPEYKSLHPKTFEAEAKGARDNLSHVEEQRNGVLKELQSLKNKERKHQWYEKRKKNRVEGDTPSETEDAKAATAGTDTEADEEAETDTTVDPDGDTSQKTLTAKSPAPMQSLPQPATANLYKEEGATAVSNASTSVASSASATPAPASRSRKRKDVFRPSDYSAGMKS
ncbi:hypothetical protein BG011_008819 [Mortierella polycephala]|uniref:Uncharacterized protein n=1 Tax=Mortierella polycephala TaxID=41804 RepID=A0A9P6Q974_9FUNG|nr:hypothetical protein BG011_008819 [Mortierella polycephala]